MVARTRRSVDPDSLPVATIILPYTDGSRPLRDADRSDPLIDDTVVHLWPDGTWTKSYVIDLDWLRAGRN